MGIFLFIFFGALPILVIAAFISNTKSRAKTKDIPNRPKCSLANVRMSQPDIIEWVKKCLILAGQEEKAIEFEKRAVQERSIGKLVNLCDEYIDRWK
jgi:hypothetical protein